MRSLFSVEKNRIMAESVIHKINVFLMILSLVCLLYVSWKRVFVTDAGVMSNEPSKRDICALVMQQMIQKKLSPKLMEESLFEQVVKDDYAALYFEGSEKISGVWSNEETCRVMTKGGRPRSFDFFLAESSDHPFFYQIIKIREHELFEKEVN